MQANYNCTYTSRREKMHFFCWGDWTQRRNRWRCCRCLATTINFLKVTIFTTKISVAEKKVLPHFLVQISPDSRATDPMSTLSLLRPLSTATAKWLCVSLSVGAGSIDAMMMTMLSICKDLQKQVHSHATQIQHGRGASDYNCTTEWSPDPCIRRTELLDFTVRQKLDIVLISETHLNPRHSITFRNLEFMRNDKRNCNVGGDTRIFLCLQYFFR